MTIGKSVMLQGTGSNVGKSLLTAAIIRALKNRGITVAPFKPQNMSNNAAVTHDGGEIGRAQALQAYAARLDPTIDMNPILLKPEYGHGSQLIIQGQAKQHVKAHDYYRLKPVLLESIMQSFNRLRQQYDMVIVEGAGSPAEINLRAGDVANMGFATAADINAILIADIDRGGVLATILGTWSILDLEDQKRLKAYIINKFRGDITLFNPAITQLKSFTPMESCGVMPFQDQAKMLPGEDSLTFDKFDDIKGHDKRKIKVVILQLGRFANSDDLDPLQYDDQIDLVIIQKDDTLPLDADLVILPGSKTTIDDLRILKQHKFDIQLQYYHFLGGYILGICGGYQMLGKSISDPDGLETEIGGQENGLGLLNTTTILQAPKTLENHHHVKNYLTDDMITGYEIHMGKTTGHDCQSPMIYLDNGRADGAISSDRRVMGCYLHGLFVNDGFRHAFFAHISQKYDPKHRQQQFHIFLDQQLDSLAAICEDNLDIDKICMLAK